MVMLENPFPDSPRHHGEADKPWGPQWVLLVAVFVSMPLCVMVHLSVMVPQSVIVSLAVSAAFGVIETALVSLTVSAVVSVLCLYLQLYRQFSVSPCL